MRKYIEELHVSYFNEITREAKVLEAKLQVLADDVRFDFVEPCFFMSASRQAQFEMDLQYHIAELNTKMQEEISEARSLFAFCHGATWQWELHLTSVAKTEAFLDSQLQKLRTALATQYDTKTAPKLRIILEALRRAGTPAAVTSQQAAVGNAAKEVDSQLKDTWKKASTYFTSYPLIVQILLKVLLEVLLH